MWEKGGGEKNKRQRRAGGGGGGGGGGRKAGGRRQEADRACVQFDPSRCALPRRDGTTTTRKNGR